jgi:putative ABC transport system substrate-binding protein
MRLIGLAVVLAVSLTLALHAAAAQPAGKAARIGILRTDTPQVSAAGLDLFRQGLADLGYVEGQHYVIETRWAEGQLDRLPRLAAELVHVGVDVIVTHGPPAIRATRDATTTIPIVMSRMDDADAHGFVASLAHPGGNITGLSFQSGQLSTKWLELLREVVPRLTRVAVLWDSTGTKQQVTTVKAAAHAMNAQTHVLEVRRPDDYEAALRAARQNKAGGIVILASPILTNAQAHLAELAARNRLPSVYYHRGFAEAGGLFAYGPSEADFNMRRAATFVDKILKGAKPADLPVEQPTKFELVINLKTAKTLGLTIPQSVLLRADQVIE